MASNYRIQYTEKEKGPLTTISHSCSNAHSPQLHLKFHFHIRKSSKLTKQNWEANGLAIFTCISIDTHSCKHPCRFEKKKKKKIIMGKNNKRRNGAMEVTHKLYILYKRQQ